MDKNKLKSMATVLTPKRIRGVHRISRKMPTYLKVMHHVFHVILFLVLGWDIYLTASYVSQYVDGIRGSAINLGAVILIDIFQLWVMSNFYDNVEEYGRLKS